MEADYHLIDFGVNFANNKRYPENVLDNIMKTAFNKGVDKVVSISNNINEAKENLILSQRYENLYFTLGIHPHNAKQLTDKNKDEYLKFIENNLANPKCFGIGECGLDFNRNFSPKEQQITTFKLQVELAKKTNSKLYLHCRDAHSDFIAILKEYQYYNGLVHCFTGTVDQAVELTGLGFKIGITGFLLDKRRNKDFIKVVSDERITLDMLIVETDAPFMAIYPNKESFPQDTRLIVEEIAKLKKIDFIVCGKKIYENSNNFLTKK